jgi:hypothetical protein
MLWKNLKWTGILVIILFIVATLISRSCQSKEIREAKLYFSKDIYASGVIYKKELYMKTTGWYFFKVKKSNAKSFNEKIGDREGDLILNDSIGKFFSSNYYQINVLDSIVIDFRRNKMLIYRRDSLVLNGYLYLDE